MKKTAARLSLELDPTPDILSELGRKKGDRLLIGFAAETENLKSEACRKLESKGADMIVGNLVGQEGSGFESDQNEVALALRSGEFIELPRAIEARDRRPDPRPGSATPDRLAGYSLMARNCCANISASIRIWGKLALRAEKTEQGILPAEAPAPTISAAPLLPVISVHPLPGLAPDNDTLLKIIEDMGDCKRCRLHAGRNKIVFGVGNEQAKLVFVGEGPGADEDVQGFPFVGRAGQLLTQMIENTASKEGIPLKRKDVYICNVVKCRPPENRTPEPDEMEICGQFLFRQLSVIHPKAICALGATAAKALLARKEGVTRMRGNWFKWKDIPVMVTYHPSYLLRPTTRMRSAKPGKI